MSRLPKPSCLSAYEQSMECALGPIQRQLDFMRSVEAETATYRLQQEVAQAQHWFDLIEQTEANMRVFKNFQTVQAIQATYFDFTTSYKNLVAPVSPPPEFFELPSYLISGAHREVFTANRALQTVINKDAEIAKPDKAKIVEGVGPGTSYCMALLQRVDPLLPKPYIGAREALKSGNTDWERHFLTSIRQLLTHLLHVLAPKEKVKALFPPEDYSEFWYKGQPTRKARIFYICRNISYYPFSDFVDQDTRLFLKFFNLLNRLHKPEVGIAEDELKAFLFRTESWIIYIVQVWEEAKRRDGDQVYH